MTAPHFPRLRLPRLGLVGRLIAILLATMVIEFAVSTLLYERASQYLVRDDEARRLAEHLVIARRLVAEAPLDRRVEMAAELTTDRYLVTWSRERPRLPAGQRTPDGVQEQVVRWEPSLARNRPQIALVMPAAAIVGALQLPDGSWLSFRTLGSVRAGVAPYQRVLSTLIPLLALMLMGGLLIRQTVQPLQALTRAVERFGRKSPGETLHVPTAGADEVRQVIAAFNSMQSRIARLIDERTRALAAVGHDLRTPLSRLRLRSDAIDDGALRDEIGADIDGMEAMINSLLAFLGGESDPETPRRVDLAVLSASVADDASDHGHAVNYVGPAHLEVMLRPSSFRRAVNNLVDNAVHYGERVTITLAREGDEIRLAVEDDGPGIPPDAIGLVCEPFVRLDTARRRDTSGFGLGLSIVTQAVAAEGGALHLSNRPEGGLRAQIMLPAALQ